MRLTAALMFNSIAEGWGGVIFAFPFSFLLGLEWVCKTESHCAQIECVELPAPTRSAGITGVNYHIWQKGSFEN